MYIINQTVDNNYKINYSIMTFKIQELQEIIKQKSLGNVIHNIKLTKKSAQRCVDIKNNQHDIDN